MTGGEAGSDYIRSTFEKLNLLALIPPIENNLIIFNFIIIIALLLRYSFVTAIVFRLSVGILLCADVVSLR